MSKVAKGRRRGPHLAIINDPVEEGPCGEVLQGRGGWPVVQQVFGGQQHQGLLKGSVQLAPESMEHLRWCGGVDNKDVGQALSVAPHVLHHHLLPHILQRHSTNMDDDCCCHCYSQILKIIHNYQHYHEYQHN